MAALSRYAISESTECLEDGLRSRSDHPKRRGRAFLILNQHLVVRVGSPSLPDTPHTLLYLLIISKKLPLPPSPAITSCKVRRTWPATTDVEEGRGGRGEERKQDATDDAGRGVV
ncbi:hypothetical protein K523DRAFT_359077 [Schizophyllum commune Tattone D]|nr:hypothetical protein K523DRAFT_359077 [Schizophyllum commune Tattone D]